MLRRVQVLGMVAVIAGCDAAPAGEKKEPTKIEAGKAVAGEATAPPAGDPVQIRPADGGKDVPPSAVYEVTVKVVADDCAPKYTAPAPWRVRVDGKAEGEVAKVNVPLSAMPPRSDTATAQRSDFVVVPATPVTQKPSSPVCGMGERTIEVRGASREGFTLAITSVFPARPDGCDAAVPEKCTTKIEQVYRVVEFLCAAECYAGQKPRPPKADGTGYRIDEDRLTVDCKCPPR